MRHEIAIAGLLLPSLLLCVLIAAALWLVLDYLLIAVRGWTLFWHPPLARLCLFLALVGAVAAAYPDF